jgi:hypothetical protein
MLEWDADRRNVTFYIGDITKPDDVRNAINKVSLVSRRMEKG